MMKINVNQVLKKYDGTPIVDVDEKGISTDATLKQAIVNALFAPVDGDQKEQPIKKYERGKLADRVYEGEEIELSADEITLIKDRIGKVFHTQVVTRCWDMLEGK